MSTSRFLAVAGIVAAFALAMSCGGNNGDGNGIIDGTPVPIEGTYRAVGVDDFDTCCTDPHDCDLGPWHEVWSFWTIDGTVYAHVYYNDLDECGEPFAIGVQSGDSFHYQNQEIYDGPWFDPFGNPLDVDCIETFTAEAVGTRTLAGIEITYSGNQTYAGDCPFDWAVDCGWQGSISAVPCDPAVCWPCGPGAPLAMSEGSGEARRPSPFGRRQR